MGVLAEQIRAIGGYSYDSHISRDSFSSCTTSNYHVGKYSDKSKAHLHEARSF